MQKTVNTINYSLNNYIQGRIVCVKIDVQNRERNGRERKGKGRGIGVMDDGAWKGIEREDN